MKKIDLRNTKGEWTLAKFKAEVETEYEHYREFITHDEMFSFQCEGMNFRAISLPSKRLYAMAWDESKSEVGQ